MTSDFLSLVLLAIIVISTGVVTALVLTRLLIRNSVFLPKILFVFLGLSIMAFNIASPRVLLNFDSNTYLASTFTEGSELWVRISQVAQAGFVLICLTGIFLSLRFQQAQTGRDAQELVKAGLFVSLPVVLSALFSGNGGLKHGLILFPLFMLTMYLNPQKDIRGGVDAIKALLLLFIYGSLVAMLLAPQWAYSSTYHDSLIGLNIRLFGLAAHANSLGYVALAFLILSRLDRQRNLWMTIHLIAAFLTLVLSQSKTAWAAWAIWTMFELILKMKLSLTRALTRLLLISLVLILVLGTFVLLGISGVRNLQDQMLTLTGRTAIWQAAYETWLENPIFGYGPTIWNLDFRLRYNFLSVGQSHNQFLQTLGESGVIGFIGLVSYLAILIKLGSRYREKTNGASFAFVIMLLTRSLSETPLRNYLLDETFLIHAILFFVLINASYLHSYAKTQVKPVAAMKYVSQPAIQ